jgi:hypothetical protein
VAASDSTGGRCPRNVRLRPNLCVCVCVCVCGFVCLCVYCIYIYILYHVHHTHTHTHSHTHTQTGISVSRVNTQTSRSSSPCVPRPLWLCPPVQPPTTNRRELLGPASVAECPKRAHGGAPTYIIHKHILYYI